MKEDEIGMTCSLYEREEICIQDFGEEAWGKETNWKAYTYIGGY